jgi:hypothetical protein
MYRLNISSDINTGYRTDNSMVTWEWNPNNSHNAFTTHRIDTYKKHVSNKRERQAKPNQNLKNKMNIECEIADRLFLDTLQNGDKEGINTILYKEKRNQLKT